MIPFKVQLAIKADYNERIKSGKLLNEQTKQSVLDYTNEDYIKPRMIKEIYSYEVHDMDFVEEMYDIKDSNVGAYETVKFIVSL